MENTIKLNVKEEKNKYRIAKIIKYVIIYALLVLWSIIVLFPFYYMIMTSFKSLNDYSLETTPKLYAYSGINAIFENYHSALFDYNLIEAFGNTLIYALTTTFLTIVVVVLAAFAFARLNFRGKNILFTIFLALMMIPNELVIITNYATFANPNNDLRNTFFSMIAPSVMSIFYVYLLRQNFMQVPDNLYWAAKVDGVTDFHYLTRVLIPLSKPTIITIIILKLIECWNSYVWPRLMAQTSDYKLVSVVIEEIRSLGSGRSNIPGMMASVVMVSLPLIIIFLIFREKIMTGVSRNGAKG